METSSPVLEYLWIHSQWSRLGAGRSVQWSVKLVLWSWRHHEVRRCGQIVYTGRGQPRHWTLEPINQSVLCSRETLNRLRLLLNIHYWPTHHQSTMSPSSSEDISDSGNLTNVPNIGPSVERIQVRRSYSYHHFFTSPLLHFSTCSNWPWVQLARVQIY